MSLCKIYLCKLVLLFVNKILNCDMFDWISECDGEVMFIPLIRGGHEVDKNIFKVSPIERRRSAVDQLG